MRASLGWTYATAGLPNTSNAFGYLVGALAAPFIGRLASPRLILLIACTVTVLALALCGITDNFAALCVARAIAGVSAAAAFVSGGAMAVEIAASDKNPDFIVSLFYVGPGLGIILSGLLVPTGRMLLGAGSWQSLWLVLAGLSAGLLVLLIVGMPKPGDRGAQLQIRGVKPPLSQMLPLLVGYGLFGAGSIGYMTFMFAQIANQGAGVLAQTSFWCVIGLGAFVATWALPQLTRRLDGGLPVAILCAMAGIGSLVPLLAPTPAAALVSASLFGSSFPGVVGGTTAFVRSYVGKGAWAPAIAAMTVAFSVGQVLGPPLTGVLSDVAGGLAFGLYGASGLLVLAALICSFQRPLAPRV
jgi:predicted MFS family arabinose efflux permease